MTAVTSLEPRPGLDGRDGTVAVTTWLEHGSDERPLNTADILRGFDGVRRQLSRREFGTDGLGAGLDVVQVDHDALALEAESRLVVVGTVTARSDRWCQIEYSAAAAAAVPGGAPGTVVARERGPSLR